MNPKIDPNLLAEIEAAAKRHLDGTRINVDRLAKNALLLARAVRAAEKLRDEAGTKS
jgi:hypothetical protein